MNFSRFDCISPIDYRYWDKEVAYYLSENGFTRYKLLVEKALIKVFHRRGICSVAVLQEVQQACQLVTTKEVYGEEERTKHDIRALVNCLREKVSDEAKPFIHMTATSFDIVDTANAARYKDVTQEIVIPVLRELLCVLAEIAEREAGTIQIGRTHGQHAVPITFGFSMAGYVSRLGECILAIKRAASRLVGKFSGAVGAYNASSLFFEDPEAFEKEVLAELGLKPAEHSTQIVPPEPITRFLTEIVIAFGVLANLARDMRSLQRTEIGEVGEEFGKEQVGSSTMPQKRNPVSFENIESLWKVDLTRLDLAFLDQVSEHQRDLTGSASSRTYCEEIAYFVYAAKRLTGVMKKLNVDKENLRRNLEMTGDLILAEPLYLILSALGYPDAHEKVRQLTLVAQGERKSLWSLCRQDEELNPYINRMTETQKEILSDPWRYTGIAAQKARTIARTWKERLDYIS